MSALDLTFKFQTAMDNTFQLLDTIIKSRLLAYNDEGYVSLLEKDVDSFRKRDKYASDEELQPIMDNFTGAFDGVDAFGPKYMISSYIKTSDAFNSLDFDWGKNKQLVSRKKFCRWMFRQAYMNNPELYDDPYSPNKEDWEMLSLFKPDLEDDVELIDITFTMLLTFQVIRPFSSDSSRALKYGSPFEVRDKMVELLEVLHNDLPTFGINNNLHTIKRALDVLNDPEYEENPLPPAALWGLLNNISLELKLNSSPAELLDSPMELNGYSMPGIWVDDAKVNQKRFWVFPNNKLMAFCFYLKNREWILEPYEFAFTKLEYEYEFDNTCVIVTTRGNMQVLMRGKIEDSEMARLKYVLEDRDDDGDFQTIRFELESGVDYPYWMNWRSFRRLPLDHELTTEYGNIINKIFYESEMLRSFDYRNIGSWITDSHDCLAGLDSEFLYLSDITLKKDGYLERIDGHNPYPLYDYNVEYSKANPGLNLFSLDISEEQPTYVVARNPLFYALLDEKLNRKSLVNDFPNRAERQAFLRRYEDFKETVMSTEFQDQVTIYKNLPQHYPDILCFNKISRTFKIDEIIEWFGVRKFTSREEMINSDVFKWRQKLR